jgi:hypothetical protein
MFGQHNAADQPRNSYNDLWSRAYQYADGQGMARHRCEQFARDYARTYEGCDVIGTPEGFMVVAEIISFDYTGQGE